MGDLGDNIDTVSRLLGIDSHTLLIILIVTSVVCNITGRVIPDTAVGWLGGVRKVCKVVGLYVQNRVAPGVTVGEMALQATETAHSANRAAATVSRLMNFPPVENQADPPIQQPPPDELMGRDAFRRGPTDGQG